MIGADLAFPFVETGAMQGESINLGLTKRELFAAMAMQGLCAIPGRFNVRQMASNAAHCADALLAELVKPQEVAP